MEEDEYEGQRYEYDIGESDSSARIDVLEAVKGETADHQGAGGCGDQERQYQSRQAYVGLVAGKPDQGCDDGGRGRARQTLEVVLVLRGPARVKPCQPQCRRSRIDKTHQPADSTPQGAVLGDACHAPLVSHNGGGNPEGHHVREAG